MKATPRWYVCLLLFSLIALCASLSSTAQTKRPLTFMDAQELCAVGNPRLSPDGRWLLYTLSVPDWKAAKSTTDIWLVSVERGLESARQMTFTKDKNETMPRWSRDGRFFVFASNREAPTTVATQNQLYLMRPDGGEARKLTEAKDGIGAFAFSKDGKWLAFSAGKDDEQQIWTLPVAEIETAKPVQLTKHTTPIASWQFAPDSKRIYFIAPDSLNKDNKERVEQKFTVRIRNEEQPLAHLWAFDLESKQEKRLTTNPNFSVSDVVISPDSRWVAAPQKTVISAPSQRPPFTLSFTCWTRNSARSKVCLTTRKLPRAPRRFRPIASNSPLRLRTILNTSAIAAFICAP